jgi:hypothetical protein
MRIKCSLLVIASFIFNFEASAQENVLLRWFNNKTDSLSFYIYYRPLQHETPVQTSPIDSLFNSLPDSLRNKDQVQKALKAFTSFFRSRPENSPDYVARLSRRRRKILIQIKPHYANEDLKTLMTILAPGLSNQVIEAEIRKNNLRMSRKEDRLNPVIQLLFELPMERLNINSKWTGNVDLIKPEPTINVESIVKENNISVLAIEKSENDTVVKLNYDIHQSFKGFLIAGGMINSITIDAEFKAQPIFSVNEGSWKVFDGTLVYRFTGYENKITSYRLQMIPNTKRD